MAESSQVIKDADTEALELQEALKSVGESLRSAVVNVLGGKMTYGQFKAIHQSKKQAAKPEAVRG
ncbi:MAG: hypothetical protein K8R57_05710 [Verrucomicrobia bacterium]|jgi:hypothetical protein|nr:hypothetical protein [Verrucomicrobiota bacterium]